MTRVIAESKVRASPPAAARHVLDQAGEKVQDLLRSAREVAEEITASARQEVAQSTAGAKGRGGRVGRQSQAPRRSA